MVQVRQHADHKRTLLFLEQLVLKHQLASRLLNVVEKPDGLDFCFPSRQVALQFSAFCESRFPCLLKQSKQLISHDASSNTHFHKYTISVTLAPLCRDDLVYVHRKQAHTQLGGFPRLALCSRVAGAGIQLVDPFTGRTTHVSVEKYWRAPFQPLCTRKHLSSFLVLDVTPLDPPYRGSASQYPSDTAPQQPQQQGHGHAAGAGSRRRRRRRHLLEGGLAAETEDEEWQRELAGGKNKREGRAAAARGKRQLGGAATEQLRSVSNGVSFCSHAALNAAPADTAPSAGGGDEMECVQAEATCSGQPEQVVAGTKAAAGKTHQQSKTLQVYEVELMRGCDVGVGDRRLITRTHLGETLQPGDWVQGYDLRSINLAGAVDSQLDEDARASVAAGPRPTRRARRRAGGGGARGSVGGRRDETSDSAEDMAVDGQTESRRKHGNKTSRIRNDGESSDGDAGAHVVDDVGELEHSEKEEENPLLRCVLYEVIIVKKQPLQRLCTAEGKGGSSGKKVQANGCKVRPWVLQTLQKERDVSVSNAQHKRGKVGHEGGSGRKGGGRSNYVGNDSDAEMEAFKDELEEDPEMRAQVNLWRDPRYSEKSAGHRAVRRNKKKTDKRGTDSLPGTAEAAPSRRGESTVEETNTRGTRAGDEREEGDGDAEDWEDYDSDGKSVSDDGETVGVKLAELLEGLTLEDGRLKGVVVRPGGGDAAAAGDCVEAGPTVPDAGACEGDSGAGEQSL
ncbi:UNVERIFIED_CONTAM: hypothetical protein H355_001561 [Colinus virginianus]|nr:hypothetical protein H355_001561 [Colinus virginianus]